MADWPYGTTAWQRLRSAKLAASPLCEPCERRGTVTPAKVVDHVVAISSGGDPFPPLEGLMSMCQSCHNFKTQSGDVRGGITFKGADLDGMPIDHKHPFWGIPLVERGTASLGPLSELARTLSSKGANHGTAWARRETNKTRLFGGGARR